MATILVWLCLQGNCFWTEQPIMPEAVAIATCESGDKTNLGDINWTAVNVNKDGTIDRGGFQFNNYWVWNPNDRWIIRPVANSLNMTSDSFLRSFPTPNDAPPYIQYAVFQYLWDDGYGWTHWSASRDCWSQWMRVTKKGQAVWR